MKKLLLILLSLPTTVFSQNTTLLDSMLRFYNYHNNGTQKLQSKSVDDGTVEKIIIE